MSASLVWGVGKTRLAIQVASKRPGSLPDGAWLVELGGISDPASIPGRLPRPRVAEPGSIDEVLIEALADKVALVVLDSCEHLLDAVAGHRLAPVPALPSPGDPGHQHGAADIEGEVVALTVPIVDPDRIDGAEQAAAADAVRLFVDRARSVSPQFELTDENAGDVARIVASG